ncbi:MAG: Glycoside hydrolase family protein [Clostridiales bacterium 38_11]|nr:MAG: Glycoside hydrolase family protein [Clostridiales bacterium 38_11]HBH12633.1 beta-phosphoglucomutase [Clostridiales bacterium]
MWRLTKDTYDPSRQMVEESLFTIGNGYVGLRGCFEEGYPQGDSIRGTYINGLYDRIPMIHAEMAYGFPNFQDKQPRIVDTQTCEVYLDGEKAQLNAGKYEDYYRWLDYQQGESERGYTYKTESGKTAKLRFNRMASLKHLNFVIYRIEVEYEGVIELKSIIYGDVENYTTPGDPRVGQGHTKLMEPVTMEATAEYVHCVLRTKTTGIDQATIIRHHAESDNKYQITSDVKNEQVETLIQGTGKLILEKIVIFTDGIRFESPLDQAKELSLAYEDWRYNDFKKDQIRILDQYWTESDIVIEGNPKDQMALRFKLFQLLQSVGKDSYSNISAKGLSGEGYEGHYFWDTEIYVLPVLMFNQHERARELLSYRYRILPKARDRAKMLGHLKGAAYPWRTISGIECSGYFPAGTAQYHINSDIAYAFIQYHLYTGDWKFMVDKGAEVIFETARIWLEIGHHHKGTFQIHDVTGPDEYTAIVNNNYYTNAMAKYHLYWANKIYKELLKLTDATLKASALEMLEQIGFRDEEARDMALASEKMMLPFDDELNLYAQDDSFLSKPIWPFEQEEFSKRPLLLYYHPLTIYRHQVLKQADTVLAHFMLEDYADKEYIKNAYDYYEKLTTHDSSLSSCAYGIMASKCGMSDRAYDYFIKTINLDLENTHGNTKDGLHIANIAGTALSVIAGFAGLRIKEEGLSFEPSCPRRWAGYKFKIHYQDRWLDISVNRYIAVALISGDPITLQIGNQKYYLTEEKPIKMILKTYKGVVFDLDGVLTETSKAHFKAWCQLAEKLGFTLSPDIEDQVRGISRLDSMEIVLKAGGIEKNYTTDEKIRLANEKNDMYIDLIKSYGSGDLSEGALELLEYFKQNGYKIALASASNNAPFLLKAMGIDSYFDTIADPKTIKKGKPAPDIFLKACEQLELQPHECIGIEDAYAGIESIKSAGLFPIGIGNQELLTNCVDVFPDLISLFDFVIQ